MKISSLPPQFVLQSSSAGESSRESSREQSREQTREQTRERKRASESALTSSEPKNREQQKSEEDGGSKREDDSSRRSPLRLAPVTTADLAAALSPEGLGLLNHTESQSGQTIPKNAKKRDESDPVADVLQRLALLAEADRRKRSFALAAYAKVRDALKPEVLPDVEFLQSLTADPLSSEGVPLRDESDQVEGARDAGELNHLSLSESFEFDSPAPSTVAFHPAGFVARAAFTHIDLAA